MVVPGDLFNENTEGGYFAHCVSSDFTLGAGIALEFNKRFNMRNILREKYGDQSDEFKQGYCVLEDRVFNLVTKRRYYNKPTYNSLRRALICMKFLADSWEIDKIAMPKIGCGLDGLELDVVMELLHDLFDDSEIEITMYV